MKFALRSILAIGMTSIALFCSGALLNKLDLMFPRVPTGFEWVCNTSFEGHGFLALGLLGMLLSFLGLALISLVRVFIKRQPHE